jgi:hypothetical protein
MGSHSLDALKSVNWLCLPKANVANDIVLAIEYEEFVRTPRILSKFLTSGALPSIFVMTKRSNQLLCCWNQFVHIASFS